MSKIIRKIKTPKTPKKPMSFDTYIEIVLESDDETISSAIKEPKNESFQEDAKKWMFKNVPHITTSYVFKYTSLIMSLAETEEDMYGLYLVTPLEVQNELFKLVTSDIQDSDILSVYIYGWEKSYLEDNYIVYNIAETLHLKHLDEYIKLKEKKKQSVK